MPVFQMMASPINTTGYWNQRQFSEKSVKDRRELGFEWVLNLPTAKDRTHPQTYLVIDNTKCCLCISQSGLGFRPIPSKQSPGKAMNPLDCPQLCILAQAAPHLTWLLLLCPAQCVDSPRPNHDSSSTVYHPLNSSVKNLLDQTFCL